MEKIRKVNLIDEKDFKTLPFTIIESIIKCSNGNFKFVSIEDGIELTQYLIKQNLLIGLADIFPIDEIPLKFLLKEVVSEEKSDKPIMDNDLQEFFSLIEEMTLKWNKIKKDMTKKGLLKVLE